MLEPITLGMITQTLATSQLVGTIIGGWLGNRSDHYLCQAAKVVYENLKHQSAPVNHDIQRAVRGAYLEATLMACKHRLYKKYNWIDRRFHLPTYDLKEVVTYLKRQLKQLNKAQFVDQPNAAEADYLLLLEPTGQPASQRVAELQQQLRKSLFKELADANLYLEDELKEAIQTGWTDDGLSVDWYDLMCAFFAERLKTDSRLSTIIQTNLLRDLRAQVPSVQWPDDLLERQAALIGEAMQPLVDQFDDVMDRLDAMLATLEEVREGVAASNTKLDGVHTKLDTLLGQPTRQPAKYLNTFAHYDLANLVGRTEQLDAIDNHFTSHRLLLLRGMGGIGKTTLARAYVSSRAAQYAHVAFLEIAETTTIADTLLNRLGTSPDLVFTADPQRSTDDNLNALLDVLRHIPDTLLVIDNANDADDLRLRKRALDSLPWTVLITSRARVGTYQQENNVLEIKKLEPDEALTLFGKLYGTPLTAAEEALVANILEKAYRHPKLIEVLAKAARENPLLELRTLQDLVVRQQFDDNEISYPIEIGDDEKPIYRILLDLFDTDRLSTEQQQLLRYFAVLPTIDIPIQHLIDLLGISEAGDRKTLLTILKSLVATGWLDDLNNRYFAMHGLVQWAVRERLKPTLENCDILIDSLILIFKDSSYGVSLDKYITFADSIVIFFELIIPKNDNFIQLALCLHKTIENLANHYKSKGETHEAEQMLNKALFLENSFVINQIQFSSIYEEQIS